MPAPRRHRHVLIGLAPIAERYTPHPRPIELRRPTPPDRVAHGEGLIAELQAVSAAATARRSDRQLHVIDAAPGIYVQFESWPGAELNLESLESAVEGIEVVAVNNGLAQTDEPTFQRATVFVPEGKVGFFLRRFEQYANPAEKRPRERRYEDMVDRIAQLRLATLAALWTDDPDLFPSSEERVWWEVWLRRHDGRELERLYS